MALLVEGESMLNDATALVAYRVALAALVMGASTAVDAFGDLVLAVVGGVAIGLAARLAGCGRPIRQRSNDPPLAILLTVLMGYASFAIADGRWRPQACSPR